MGEINKTNAKAISRLISTPKSEWPAIYWKLNRWEWDDRLGDKPKNWDNMPQFYRGRFRGIKNIFLNNRYKIIKPIRDYIKLYIGERELLHYYHIVVLGNTEDEFKEWIESYLLNHCDR
ncbi:hypothetical protein [Acetobacterium wieringae]|uniref:hypothetical protein n=1 Tax=Acetobacterium wieringae TaxID=52694 RepID=UPI0031581EAD